MATLSFWCSATNTMIFPLGSLGSMVLDISAILGTSPTGLPIDIALSEYKFDLDLKTIFKDRSIKALMQGDQSSLKEDEQKLHKNFFNYNTLVTHFAGSEGGVLKMGEHEAFLFY